MQLRAATCFARAKVVRRWSAFCALQVVLFAIFTTPVAAVEALESAPDHEQVLDWSDFVERFGIDGKTDISEAVELSPDGESLIYAPELVRSRARNRIFGLERSSRTGFIYVSIRNILSNIMDCLFGTLASLKDWRELLIGFKNFALARKCCDLPIVGLSRIILPEICGKISVLPTARPTLFPPRPKTTKKITRKPTTTTTSKAKTTSNPAKTRKPTVDPDTDTDTETETESESEEENQP